MATTNSKVTVHFVGGQTLMVDGTLEEVLGLLDRDSNFVLMDFAGSGRVAVRPANVTHVHETGRGASFQ